MATVCKAARSAIALGLGVAIVACSDGDPNVVDVATESTTSDPATASSGAEADGNVAGDSQPPTNEAVPIESTGADELRDLIRPDDPTAFACLVDQGVAPGEFYDKITDELLFPEQTFYFEARYSDGATVEIRIHPDIAADTAGAEQQALRLARPVGLLPSELRADIGRIGFLGGDATAQGDGGGEGIHVYEENVATREAAGRLEETLFHESVHTSLDDRWAQSDEWLAAQQADGQFLTLYARSIPEREDLAETALYAWALLHHPDRVSDADAEAWRSLVPNRIGVIETILSGPPASVTGNVEC